MTMSQHRSESPSGANRGPVLCGIIAFMTRFAAILGVIILSGFPGLYVIFLAETFRDTGKWMEAVSLYLLMDSLILSVPIGLILATVASGFLLAVPVTRVTVVFAISINAFAIPTALLAALSGAAAAVPLVLLFWAFVGFVMGFIFLLRSIHLEPKQEITQG